ncbi:MAG: response regulator, partial [Myxococcota bacterium]
MKKIKLMILDDHRILRAGLRMLLESERLFTIVGEADSGVDMLKILESESCDILLLDITLNNENGLEVMKEIRKRYPEVKIIVLTMHENAQYIKQALKEGAKGYV